MNPTNKIYNIFDWLNEISFHKSPVSDFNEEDWKHWNNYMINRFVSMDSKYLELVNEAQNIPPQHNEELYKFYSSILPKEKKFFKYIKSNTKTPNKDLVSIISIYFECSTKEAQEYVLILSKEQLEEILIKLGKDPKEIKKLLK